MATITGTSGNDTLTGTSASDTIQGLAGDDILEGLDGADVLDGWSGADTLIGGDGDDTLDGSFDADQLVGGAGNDTASYTGSGGVTVSLADAGLGTGHAQGDTFTGVENLTGSTSRSDTLVGDAGANVLRGLGHMDVLEGGGGADTLDGGTSADGLDGGDGIDTASYVNAAAAVAASLTTGQGTAGEANGDNFTAIENLLGSAYDDVLVGHAGANNLRGRGGTDALSGGDGDDVLEGEGGADELDGGAGNDTASYANAAAGVMLNFATGVHSGDAVGDTFVNIERFQGSAFADVLTGQLTSDYFDGGDGNDILEGGLGADELNGGNGVDTASYVNAALAVVVDLTTGAHTGEAQGDLLTTIENLRGSAYADTLTGDAGANRLEGVGGDDLLVGGGNNDVLQGGYGADQLDGGTGVDTATYANAPAAVGVNLATGGYLGQAAGDTFSGIENLVGSAYNDTLIGDVGANNISGKAGADVLQGGGGIDRFDFDLTSESGAGLGNRDKIDDFSEGVDDIDLSGIDAIEANSGNQAFVFVGTGSFTQHGQARYFHDGSNTIIQANTDGVDGAELEIQLAGTFNLTAGDFVL